MPVSAASAGKSLEGNRKGGGLGGVDGQPPISGHFTPFNQEQPSGILGERDYGAWSLEDNCEED